MCAHVLHPSVAKRLSASTEQLGRNAPNTIQLRWFMLVYHGFPPGPSGDCPPFQLFPVAYLPLVSAVQERVHLAAQPQRTELLNRRELTWWC